MAQDITERKLAEEKLKSFAAALEVSNRELESFHEYLRSGAVFRKTQMGKAWNLY